MLSDYTHTPNRDQAYLMPNSVIAYVYYEALEADILLVGETILTLVEHLTEIAASGPIPYVIPPFIQRDGRFNLSKIAESCLLHTAGRLSRITDAEWQYAIERYDDIPKRQVPFDGSQTADLLMGERKVYFSDEALEASIRIADWITAYDIPVKRIRRGENVNHKITTCIAIICAAEALRKSRI